MSVVTVRRAKDADLAWLEALYASTRSEELAQVPWPEAAKQAFLSSQFDLQHRHFVTHYADAEFLIVERSGVAIGRYYVLRGDPFHVVDISLLPDARRQGIGTLLIKRTQDEARTLGRPLVLHVAKNNPQAQQLYARLGFAVDGDANSHLRMRWMP